MKALYFEEHGSVDNLKFGTRPDPQPGPGQVLVRLKTAALNHLDLFVLEGLPGVPIPLPHIGGADGAGIVEAVGEGVTKWQPGEEVVFDAGISCGRCEFCLKGEHSLCVKFGIIGEHVDGTFAEFVVVDEAALARKPSHLSWEEAAAFPLTFLTAWRMLFTRGKLSPGETVLIHGIGGGVSLASLILAKAAGATVFVTSRSQEKLDRALELGADQAIPAGPEVPKIVRKLTAKRGVDVVVDSVGHATWLQSLKCAAKGGRILTCGATSGPNPEEEIRIIFWNQLTIIGSTMGSRDDWRRMVTFVENQRLKPVVDEVMPLSEGKQAYQRLTDAQQFGKLVLQVP